MADLTPDRLQELRRIAEAATPGPLTVHLCDDARYAAFVDAPHLGPDTPELAVFLIERDAHFFAEFDRDTVLAMLNEVEHLRREVREWMCDGCSTVYPDPPQPGIWCVQCPRCGGDTAPRGVIERRRLEREVERLREDLEQLEAARAEAERWTQQYEALWAGVERVVQHLYERTRATARDWRQSGHPYHDGASDAYCEAFLKVRRVLGEAATVGRVEAS